MESYPDFYSNMFDSEANDLYPSVLNEDANDSFKKSSIYAYSKSNPDNTELAAIITKAYYLESKFRGDASVLDKLYDCYTNLIDKKMDDIIYQMIGANNSDDVAAICKVAIDNSRLDIIQAVSSVNYNFNRSINESFNNSYATVTDYALLRHNLPIVKHILENGGNLNVYDEHDGHDRLYLPAFAILHNDEIVNYIIDTYEIYHNILIFTSIMHDKLDYVKRILEYGTDIDMGQIQSFFEATVGDAVIPECMLSAKCSPELLQLLVSYGLNVNDKIFTSAFCNRNDELVDYLITDYHFMPSDSLITDIFMEWDLNMLRIMIKHKIDLSNIKPISQAHLFIDPFIECGMDLKTLSTYLMSAHVKQWKSKD